MDAVRQLERITPGWIASTTWTRPCARVVPSWPRVPRARCSTSTTAPIPLRHQQQYDFSAGACTGLGIPTRIGRASGIFKAYCPRGGGPFPHRTARRHR